MTTEADPPPDFGGNVRQDPPFAVRNYRHPGTGEEAVLSVRMHYPCGQARFFVKVTGPDGRSNVPGVLWGASVVRREPARQEWAERERELRAAGYERV